MRETPLITFTKADDAGCGQRDPGDLDYIIHCDAIVRWLSNGSVEHAQDVAARCRALATELRGMADHLSNGTGPVLVSCEEARERYAERARTVMAAINKTASTP